jgi:hypothetical protein
MPSLDVDSLRLSPSVHSSLPERDCVDILQGLANLLGPHSHSNIGIKRMCELDEKPFVLSCKEMYGEDAEMKAAEFVCMWQEHVKDPNWHPFKIVTTGSNIEVCPSN